MKFDHFKKLSAKKWTEYFSFIAEAQRHGYVASIGTPIFPNLALFTDTGDHYVMEFFGAQRSFDKLSVKTHRSSTVYRYLSQFDDEHNSPAIIMGISNNSFSHLNIGLRWDIDSVKDRFPSIGIYESGLNFVSDKPPRDSIFLFPDEFMSMWVDNCVIINRREEFFRCKTIMYLLVVSKNITDVHLAQTVPGTYQMAEVRGIQTVPSDDVASRLVAGQLQSLYLTDRLRETTIGEFLKNNPRIVRAAFGGSRFIYEPLLKWKNPGAEKFGSINPDFMVQRADGRFDIYDIKTAVLHRNSITKGRRARRRFIDDVGDGIAQLANYREYFEFDENVEYAKEKYGVEVRSPELVLVVGSWENADRNEIQEASRMLKGITVIDYDTLIQLFLGGAPAQPL